MPSLRPMFRTRPLLLLAATLLATLVLTTWPRPAASQEALPVVANATATANATNATEWVMPPEVEALFPKDAVFDEKRWHVFTQPPTFPTKRFKIKFVRGTYAGVCHDYEININLWGGKYELGSSWTPIHPNHPHKDRFRTVEWEKLDPCQHVNIIRDIINRDWRRTNTQFSNANPDYMWDTIAPILKRILFGQSDGAHIYLERAKLDIANNGEIKDVYRYACYPTRAKKAANGELMFSWIYYFVDNSDFIIGEYILSAYDLFYYMNKLYVINEVGMEIQDGFKYNGKIGFSTRCEFGILK